MKQLQPASTASASRRQKTPRLAKIKVSQIQVIEQEGTKMHDVSYRDKARAGGKINEDIFKR